jgi:hypothetical protein
VQQPIESPSRAGESQFGCDGRKEEPMQPVERAIITPGELEVRYLIDGTANGRAAGMFELTVPPGRGCRRPTATVTTRRWSTAWKAHCSPRSEMKCAI